jgi:hypothetical protein
MTHIFTPREAKTNRRLEMQLDDTNMSKIKRGKGWSAIVTNTDGKRYEVRSASCGLDSCYCDAIATLLES